MQQAMLANQIPDGFLNPRQEAFLKNYLDPLSGTFSNITQSGIKAGFSPDYSESLMALMPKWLEDSIGDAKRMRLAENNLSTLLEQNDDLKVKADMTKFALSTMGRKKYSTRTEQDITSNGESISQINYIMPKDIKDITDQKVTDISVEEKEIPKTEIIPPSTSSGTDNS